MLSYLPSAFPPSAGPMRLATPMAFLSCSNFCNAVVVAVVFSGYRGGMGMKARKAYREAVSGLQATGGGRRCIEGERQRSSVREVSPHPRGRLTNHSRFRGRLNEGQAVPGNYINTLRFDGNINGHMRCIVSIASLSSLPTWWRASRIVPCQLRRDSAYQAMRRHTSPRFADPRFELISLHSRTRPPTAGIVESHAKHQSSLLQRRRRGKLASSNGTCAAGFFGRVGIGAAQKKTCCSRMWYASHVFQILLLRR